MEMRIDRATEVRAKQWGAARWRPLLLALALSLVGCQSSTSERRVARRPIEFRRPPPVPEQPMAAPVADEPPPEKEEERVLALLREEKSPPARARTREEIRAEVEAYIRRLKADEDTALEAYRELWDVDKELIPELIEHTDDRDKSGLRELAVLVLDPKKFYRQDKDGAPIYTIPGLGAFELDDIAAGKVRAGAKAVIRNFERFPVGVVVRAALVNRFRSSDYPSGDDQRDLKGWWRRYYQRVRPNL